MPTSATVTLVNYLLTEFTSPPVTLLVVWLMMLATCTALFYRDTVLVLRKVIEHSFNDFAIIHIVYFKFFLCRQNTTFNLICPIIVTVSNNHVRDAVVVVDVTAHIPTKTVTVTNRQPSCILRLFEKVARRQSVVSHLPAICRLYLFRRQPFAHLCGMLHPLHPFPWKWAVPLTVAVCSGIFVINHSKSCRQPPAQSEIPPIRCAYRPPRR